ncbi:MAG: hypothetical protein ACYDBP_06605 [Leptospirales bacterium]
MNIGFSADKNFDPHEQHLVVEKDKLSSFKDFDNHVKPFIEKFKNAGRKVVTDMSLGPDGRLYESGYGKEILDRGAGIDGFIIDSSKISTKDIKELAEKVMSGEKGVKAYTQRMRRRYYESFTVRTIKKSGFETEYAKLLNRIKENDPLRPHISIQGLVVEDRFKAVGIVKTDDLGKYIIDNIDHKIKSGSRGEKEKGSEIWSLIDCKDKCGNFDTQFLSISWQALQKAGIHVDIYRF